MIGALDHRSHLGRRAFLRGLGCAIAAPAVLHATPSLAQAAGRIRATGPTSFWIHPTRGSDTPNAGTSPTMPWATRDYAYRFVRDNWDVAGQQVYFKMYDANTDGSPSGQSVVYSDVFAADSRLFGQGGVYPLFVGAVASPWSDSALWLTLVNTSGTCWTITRDAEYGVTGTSMQSGAGFGVFSQWGGRLQLGQNIFGACAAGHMQATKDSWVFQGAASDPNQPNYVIWGGGTPYHALPDEGVCFISGGNRSVATVYGTPLFSSAFVGAKEPHGLMLSHTQQWSGPGWTYSDATKSFNLTPHGIAGKKFEGTLGASIGNGWTGQGQVGQAIDPQVYWPGSAPGTVAAPGIAYSA